MNEKIVNLNQTDKGQGHIIPDFEEVLKKGYQNIKKELEENLKKDEEIDFLRSYVTEIIANESILIERIKDVLEGWTYERLGTIEKVLLKVSFYEITIKNVGYEIAINEVLEIAKKYSYNDTKDFLNGILAKLIKNIKEEKYK